MKFRNQFLKYHFCQNQAGTDGADGGSGGNSQGEAPKTYTQADFEKAVQEAVAGQVAGLKTKNGELIGEKKQLKEQLAQFDGIDPVAVRAMLQNSADKEEADLIANGKIDEVLSKRTERMKASHDKELAKLQGELSQANERMTKFADRALSAEVREQGASLNIHQTAYDDALLRAKAMFDIDDNGKAVAKDGVVGKDGKPLTLKEWFEGMKETAPHWFPAPSGGGSQSSSGGGSKTMSRAEFEQLSPEQRATTIKSGVKII